MINCKKRLLVSLHMSVSLTAWKRSVPNRWIFMKFDSYEITNKMQPCIRIYYSTVHWRHNMFRGAYRSSSGALTVFAASGLHTVCRSRHVESAMNGGIINSNTQLHLVGYFYWVILRCTDPLMFKKMKFDSWEFFENFKTIWQEFFFLKIDSLLWNVQMFTWMFQ